jgi:hypothetical protein
MKAGTSPRTDHISLLIEFDQLRPANAAVDPVVFAADFVRVGFRRPIQEPDVVVSIDKNTGDLLHAPSIRQRLRPEGIYPEQRRAIAVNRLPWLLLRALDGSGGNQNTAHSEDGGVSAAFPHSCIHENLPLFGALDRRQA